jgi:hypothetical protein
LQNPANLNILIYVPAHWFNPSNDEESDEYVPETVSWFIIFAML